MIVKNTQPNVKHILGAGMDSVALTLLPGINDVPASAWEKAKENDLVKMWIRAGLLIEGDSKKSARTLKEYDNATAIELVDGCVDVNLLREWQAKEMRGDVLSVIAAQLKKIEPDPEK